MTASTLSVGQYMTRGPYKASPKESLGGARRLMDEHAIRHLPVEAEGKLVGMLSARDLQLVWTLAHAPPEALTVEDAMTPDPYTVRPETPLDEVVHVMAERKIGSAAVLERGHIVGVFTSTDAMRALADILGELSHETRAPSHGRGAGEDGDVAGRLRSRIAKSARLPHAIAVDDAVTMVMCTLVERLTAGEAHQLLEALPRALRPMVETCISDREGRATEKLDRAAFLDRVADRIGVTPAHAELVCEAVFEAVRQELPEGLVRDVGHQLPRGLVQLWRAEPPLEPTGSGTLTAYEARRVIEEEVAAATPLPRGITSQDVFSAVMCAFSDRLSRGEAREVLLGLPDTLRPLVDQCMLHRAEPAVVFGEGELLRRVGDHLHVDEPRAKALIRAVLSAVKKVLPERAVRDVGSQLPADLEELWASAGG